MIGISIICPTVGRPSLGSALITVIDQMIIEDELIIIIDTDDMVTPMIIDMLKRIVPQYNITLHTYNDYEMWGNRKYILGHQLATKDVIIKVNDDDSLAPNALTSIREVVEKYPNRLIMGHFIDINSGIVYGMEHKLEQDKTADVQLIIPNNKDKFGMYLSCSDWSFTDSILKLYPEGPIWIDKVLYLWNMFAYQAFKRCSGSGALRPHNKY